MSGSGACHADCLCKFLRPISNGGCMVTFTTEEFARDRPLKLVYIKSMDRTSTKPYKDLTEHDFVLSTGVQSVTKCYPLYEQYDPRNFAKVCFGRVPSLIMKKVLESGLMVRIGRSVASRYEFFAHSATQLREGCCVFYDVSLGDWNALIATFGAFDRILNVSKMGARLGLLLSSTVGGIFIPDAAIQTITDIENDKYCFTDGCGLISGSLVDRIVDEFDLSWKPSVFQVRLQGCKGTLVFNPHIAAGIVCIRPSMKKFDWRKVGPHFLGICDDGMSRPYTFGVLNKQYIMIMSARGIADAVFLQLQEEQFRDMAMLMDDKRLAVRYLCAEERFNLAERLVQGGPMDTETREALEKIRLRLKLKPNYESQNPLKKKKKETVRALKIVIEQSRNLFGVCDPAIDGKPALQSGEVFVQVTVDGRPKVLEDGTKVIVVKCPCYALGDIRVLTCRAIEALKHLVDCVVFPVQGERPHADEIAGSDLDGDKFFVCWDQRLVPRSNVDPFSYDAHKAKDKSSPVQRSDLIDAFAKYDRSIVGTLNNLYVEWATKRKNGIKCLECDIINKLFARAIDAAKTGDAVRVSDAVRKPPAQPAEGYKAIWVQLEDKAELYIADKLEFFSSEQPKRLKELFDEEDIEDMLESRHQRVSEFQLFRLIYKWCCACTTEAEFTGYIEKLLLSIDVGAFTLEQKRRLTIDLPPDLHRCLVNGLYQSVILTPLQADRVGNSPGLDWVMYYRECSSCVNWMVLRNALGLPFPKLVMFQLNSEDLNWIFVLHVFESWHADVEDMIFQESEFPMRAYFIKHRTTFARELPTDYSIKITKDRIQIYLKSEGATWIWIKNDHGSTKLSVDLNQFPGFKSIERLYKLQCTCMEIFLQEPSMECVYTLLQVGEKQQLAPLSDSDLSLRQAEDFLMNINDFPLYREASAGVSSQQTDSGQMDMSTQFEHYEKQFLSTELSKSQAQQLVEEFFNLLENNPQLTQPVHKFSRPTARWTLGDYVEFDDKDSACASTTALSSVNSLLSHMIIVGAKFTHHQLLSLMRTLLFSHSSHHDIVEQLTQWLLLIKDDKCVIPLQPSAWCLDSHVYFLHFLPLITIETMKEFGEAMSQARVLDGKHITKGVICLPENDDAKERTQKNDATFSVTLVGCSPFTRGMAIAMTPMGSADSNDAPTFAPVAIAEISNKRGESFVCTPRWPSNAVEHLAQTTHWRIDSVPNITPYDRMCNALERLCYCSQERLHQPHMEIFDIVMRSLLWDLRSHGEDVPKPMFNNDAPNVLEEYCLNTPPFAAANQSQKEAIKATIHHRISLIQGPPGTGKTKTSALIVQLWLKRGKYGVHIQRTFRLNISPVICVAETNEGVNNLALKLLESGISERDIIRIGGADEKLPESLKSISLEERYAQTYNNGKVSLYGMDTKKSRQLLREAKILCVTCKGAGSQMLTPTDDTNDLSIKAVLVDEAAQALEVAVLIPLALCVSCERLCLVGDDKQLPPTVNIQDIKDELGLSLFERLRNIGLPVYMLNVQYRMHPQIAFFPNQMFYDNKLKNGVHMKDRPLMTCNGWTWPNANVPVAFIDCTPRNDKEREKGKNKSKYNELEATVVVDLVERFKKMNANCSIGVISGYSAQVACLKAMNTHDVDVRSVDGFQGQERELIIFSAVRNQESIGFLSDQRRVNVMLTRAKRGLIVVGCRKTLMLDETWKQWLSWVDCNHLEAVAPSSNATPTNDGQEHRRHARNNQRIRRRRH